MEDVDMDKIINAGIRGMLSDLDRFSVLMEKQSYDALMESTHGKYEGLGLQIDSHGDHITIVSPIEGTPAYNKGLRAGDIIWEIDGKSTYEMTSSDAAKLMRGEAGTSIRLTIKREGIPDLLEFDVERAVITLKSVNYYGIIPGTNIGYVRLSRFAEETSQELRDAINDLNDQGISSLVFDLRSNGGGLLDQAKETAELFLKEGSEIVYTKGRFSNSERHYKSERPPIFPPDKPLVVLVDEGTASASEIVAGAIQDWDRGLIIGNTTYGKGLVQQLFPISPDRSEALKLTTAKYYVPSGRCIQKPEHQAKNHGEMTADEDVSTDLDTAKVSNREVYYTNGGRVVYGGGGIVPDIIMDRETWKPIEINLERKSMFFDFAVKYIADHPEVKPDLQVTPEVLAQFQTFIKDKDFEYKTSLQVALEDLEKTVNDQDKQAVFASSIDDMKTLIDQEKQNDFNASTDYIKRAIKREIVRAIAGERGVYEQTILKTDKTVQKAVEVLESPKDYARLITETKPKSEL
jgi:carboxyl-terminal processing protease